MKKGIALFLTLLMMLSLASFAGAEEAINVYALKGPTGIGMVMLMENHADEYNISLAGAPDEVAAAVASGSVDIAAMPTNYAAMYYNKTNGDVQLLALNTLGVLSILENGDSIQSVEDLAGKTIYATGQGSTPEYVLNYILEANGLTDSVTVEYKAEHAELATLAAAGEVELAMLPEPNVTSVLMQNSDFRIALDVTELFDEAAAMQGEEGATMSMGCVVVRREFAEKNPEKVTKFLSDYLESVTFVNSDVEAASELVEKHGIIPKAAVAKQAIPNCHIVLVTGEKMKAQIGPFFDILYNANPASVGGVLPEEDFYYLP